ncbi:uncharacterized protein MONBRDRAFT_34473, partial [Monosiga brevicollis MX1]
MVQRSLSLSLFSLFSLSLSLSRSLSLDLSLDLSLSRSLSLDLSLSISLDLSRSLSLSISLSSIVSSFSSSSLLSLSLPVHRAPNVSLSLSLSLDLSVFISLCIFSLSLCLSADLVQGISNQVLDEVNELFRRDAGCNCVNTSLYSTNDNIAACRKAILIETIDRIINETFEDRLVALEAAVSNAAGCFAGHTMVMKADGSMARVDSLTTGDMLKCLDEDYNAT